MVKKYKNIPVSQELHKTLIQMKIDTDKKSLEEVIKDLIWK